MFENISIMLDKRIKNKYSIHRKGTFVKYKYVYHPFDLQDIRPIIKYTYNNKVYTAMPVWVSTNRDWLYAKEGEEVDIYINPNKPRKFYAVVPKLSPKEQESEKKYAKRALLAALVISIFMAVLFIVVLFTLNQ